MQLISLNIRSPKITFTRYYGNDYTYIETDIPILTTKDNIKITLGKSHNHIFLYFPKNYPDFHSLSDLQHLPENIQSLTKNLQALTTIN